LWKAFPQLTVFDDKTVTLGSVTYYGTDRVRGVFRSVVTRSSIFLEIAFCSQHFSWKLLSALNNFQ